MRLMDDLLEPDFERERSFLKNILAKEMIRFKGDDFCREFGARLVARAIKY